MVKVYWADKAPDHIGRHRAINLPGDLPGFIIVELNLFLFNYSLAIELT